MLITHRQQADGGREEGAEHAVTGGQAPHMDPLVVPGAMTAIIAARGTAAPPPPPRRRSALGGGVDLLTEPVHGPPHADASAAVEWAVSEVAPPRRRERDAGAVLPPWLLRQRDDLFREATSFTQESAVAGPRRGPAPEPAAAAESARGMHFVAVVDDTVTDSDEVRRRPCARTRLRSGSCARPPPQS